jgi:hypothetical protein
LLGVGGSTGGAALASSFGKRIAIGANGGSWEVGGAIAEAIPVVIAEVLATIAAGELAGSLSYTNLAQVIVISLCAPSITFGASILIP